MNINYVKIRIRIYTPDLTILGKFKKSLEIMIYFHFFKGFITSQTYLLKQKRW